MPRFTHLFLIDPRCVFVSNSTSASLITELSLGALYLQNTPTVACMHRSLGWNVVPHGEQVLLLSNGAESLAAMLHDVGLCYPFDTIDPGNESAACAPLLPADTIEEFQRAVIEEALGASFERRILLALPRESLTTSPWIEPIRQQSQEFSVCSHGELLQPRAPEDESMRWTLLIGSNTSLGVVSTSRDSQEIRLRKGLDSSPPSFRDGVGKLPERGLDSHLNALLHALVSEAIQRHRGHWGTAQQLPLQLHLLAPREIHPRLHEQLPQILLSYGVPDVALKLSATGSALHQQLFSGTDRDRDRTPRALRPRSQRSPVAGA